VSCDGATWRNDPTSLAYRWLLDGQTIDGATEQTYTIAAAAVGRALVCTVRAANDAGITDAASQPVRVLSVRAPDFSATPGARTNDITPSFAFSADGAKGYQCSVDGSAFSSCRSPLTIGPLAEGAHDLRVRALDDRDRTGPATRAAFVIDLAAPDTTISAAPSAMTRSRSAVVRFSSSEAGSTFKCRLDSQPWGSCTSPKGFTGLADGRHAFSVRATDRVGNPDRTPATTTWTIDTQPPDTKIVKGPPTNTRATSTTIGFTATEKPSSFQCRLDTQPFQACTNPVKLTGRV
jgi:hypothetical protein